MRGVGGEAYDLGMSVIHATTMHPSKLELLAEWLPLQPWFSGDIAQLSSLGAYRFDDPEGEVGLEGYLLTAGGDTVYHVPLSYRGALLEGGEASLVGTSEHGVLGTRWISDATGDPVYRAVLATAIAQGGSEAQLVLRNADGAESALERAVHVRGSGSAGAPVPGLWDAVAEEHGDWVELSTPLATLAVRRVVDPAVPSPAIPSLAVPTTEVLRATWPGQLEPTVLAALVV